MPPATSTAARAASATPLSLLAWALTLALPLALFGPAAAQISVPAALLLALMMGAAVQWMFRVVPDFVIGLALLWLAVLLGLAPPALAFSGFASPVFLLVLGVFLLSALLTESPWMAYGSAALLRRTQRRPRQRIVAVLGSALALSLVLPSPLGRSALIAPLLKPLAAGQSPRFQTALVFAMAQGNTLWSTVFLTGNPLNFVLLGLLDVQSQQRFQWLYWALAAAGFALVASLGLALILAWLLHGSAPRTTLDEPAALPAVPAPQLRDAALPVLYALLFVAILTRAWHGLELHLVIGALALLGYYLAPMPLATLRARLDWPTLLYIATLVAWQPMLQRLGVDAWLAARLPALAHATQLADAPQWLALLALAVLVGLIRLVVPGAPAFIVLAASLLPLASTLGLSPWALGFALLSVSEGFVLAHQHGVLSHLLSEAQAEGLALENGRLLTANLAAWALRVLAVLASLPWWRELALA